MAITYYAITATPNDSNYGSVSKTEQNWFSNSGSICGCSTSNGSTGTGYVPNSTNITYRSKVVNYSFKLQNPDGFDRPASYYVGVNGSAAVNWSGYIGSDRTIASSVSKVVEGFTYIQCHAEVTSNGSSGSAYVSSWDEKGKNDYYASEDSVTVSATPNEGYRFINWTINGVEVSTSTSYTFIVSQAQELVANFEEDYVRYTVSTNVGGGNGSVIGAGSYIINSQCTLTAIPSFCYDFAEFRINGSTVSTSATYTFTVTQDITVEAIFTHFTWINPIYDRTQEDIDNKTSKAYLNLSDIRRIDRNISILAELYEVSTNYHDWIMTDIPTTEQWQRILDNLEILEERVPLSPDIPENQITTFEKVNQIEYITQFLFDYYRNYIDSPQPMSPYYSANEPLSIKAERN